MRLSIKLLLAFMAIMLLMIGVSGMMSFNREVKYLENDLRDRLSVQAHQLAILCAEVWHHAGEARAAHMLDSLNLQQPMFTARLVKLEEASDHVQAPAVHSERLKALLRGKHFSLFEDENERQRLLAYAPVVVNNEQVGAVEVSQPMKVVRAYTRGTAMNVAVLSMLLVLVGFAVVVPIGMALVARPVQRLIDKTRKIGQGDLQGNLALKGHDEFTELAQAINQMCENLGQAQKHAQQETERRIDALHQLRHTERLATLGQISSGIAHELGTPLNVISGRAKILVQEALSKDEVAENARTIVMQVERVTGIIREFLDFARRPQLQGQPVNIADAIQRTMRLLEPLAKKSQVEMRFTGAAADATVKGDRNQLQQVFSNIMMNAVQVMTAGGAITVACRIDTRDIDPRRGVRCVVVDMRDTGPGVAPGDREKIFEPFYTTKDPGKGTGLGLSIARDIVRDHGGDITVGGEPGGGAVFSVVLPIGGEL
jgi:two-component system, NtrC family, sensor kinase